MKGSALSATLPAGGLGQVGGQGRARVLPLLVLLLLIDRSEPKFPPTSGRRPLFPEADQSVWPSRSGWSVCLSLVNLMING